MKLLYYIDKSGEWRWQIKARNGRIIEASTEGFPRKWNAKRNFKLFIKSITEIK